MIHSRCRRHAAGIWNSLGEVLRKRIYRLCKWEILGNASVIKIQRKDGLQFTFIRLKRE